MFSWIVIIAVSVTCTLLSIRQWRKRPKNFPPGPVGLPVVGSALKLGRRAEVGLMKLSEKYGGVMGLKIVGNFTVILSSREAIQEALVKKGNDFSGRPNSIMFETLTDKRGIAGIDGPKWKENRRFGIVIMRSLGVGRSVMEDWIVEESMCLCEELQSRQGAPVRFSKLMMHAIANVICRLVVGERFSFDDKEFVRSSTALVDWFGENSNIFMMLVFAPFLRHIRPFKTAVESLKKSKEKVYNMMKPIIQKHRDTLSDNEYRDFVEGYLQQMEKTNSDPNTVFNDDDLLGYVRDLFVAGTDTTVSTMRWTMIFLLNRPKLQRKIQNEIDTVIGPDARPKMSHLEEMHYTKVKAGAGNKQYGFCPSQAKPLVNAFIHEMLRFRTPGPLGLAHRAIRDTTLMGYNIPKDTQVIANLWAIHHDPKLWEEPEKFDPERFLDDDGVYEPSPNSLAFSAGARHCMGESIAMMEIFLFTVSILQRFHLRPESADVTVSEESSKSGQFLISPEYKVVFKERFSRDKSIKRYRDKMLSP